MTTVVWKHMTCFLFRPEGFLLSAVMIKCSLWTVSKTVGPSITLNFLFWECEETKMKQKHCCISGLAKTECKKKSFISFCFISCATKVSKFHWFLWASLKKLCEATMWKWWPQVCLALESIQKIKTGKMQMRQEKGHARKHFVNFEFKSKFLQRLGRNYDTKCEHTMTVSVLIFPPDYT